MKIVVVRRGPAFTIFALDLSGDAAPEDCPAKEFLSELDRNYPAASKSITNLLIRHAEHGPIHDSRKWSGRGISEIDGGAAGHDEQGFRCWSRRAARGGLAE